MSKLKLTRSEISEMVQRSIKKVLKEDWRKEYDANMGLEDNMSIGRVLLSYLEALLWSAGEDLDGYSIEDIDEGSVMKSKNDILKFIKLIENNQEAIEEMNSYDEESFGHNLALSRNGHGAGFFDDNNDILQDLARNFGGADLYAGDDGKLYIMGAEGGVSESKKLKLKKSELTEITEMVKKTILKVLKEDWDGGRSEDYENSRGTVYDHEDEIEEFTPHGSYTVSNSGGYTVMLSDDGEMAKVKDAFGSDNPEISDWLPIEYVPSEDEFDEDGNPEMVAVIDPNGYNIPLNQVMRIRESKKLKITKSNLVETIQNVIKKVLKENYHEGPTPDVAPVGYQIGSQYYYVNDNNLGGVIFVIDSIENGTVSAYSNNSYQDNPSTNELNNALAGGSVRLKQVNESKNKIKISINELKNIIKSVIKEDEDLFQTFGDIYRPETQENNAGDDLIPYEIPEWAMSSLINGDDSGLEDEDIQKINSFVNRVSSEFGNAKFMMDDIDGEDNLGFRRSNDIDNLGSNVYRLYIRPN